MTEAAYLHEGQSTFNDEEVFFKLGDPLSDVLANVNATTCTCADNTIRTSRMVPVRIRHSYSAHKIATQSSHSVDIERGNNPKWLPLNFGYHDIMHTAIVETAHGKSGLMQFVCL